jgi:hypothetical protein
MEKSTTRRVISVEMTAEQANEYISRFSENNKHDISCGQGEEWWLGISNGTIKSIVLTNEKAYLTDYGISTYELRITTSFAVACMTDGDVNHGLDYDGEEAIMNDGDLEDLVKFLRCETNILPVTPCGLVNYCYDHLEFGYLSISFDEWQRLMAN